MRLILLFSFLLSLKSFSQIDVTFKVDMQYQLVSENGIHIAGTMQSWNPSSTPLTDANGDDIWEVTLTLAENTIYEYKFINGNSWGSDEAVLEIVVLEMVIDKSPQQLKICHYQHMFSIPATLQLMDALTKMPQTMTP